MAVRKAVFFVNYVIQCYLCTCMCVGGVMYAIVLVCVYLVYSCMLS